MNTKNHNIIKSIIKEPDWLKLIVATLGVLALGVSGSLFVNRSIGTWYTEINKPELLPPNWIFGPVWTILFIMIGVSFYRVWRNGFVTQLAMNYRNTFWFQMILNVGWNGLFFGLRNPALGLVGIVGLWLTIVKLIWVGYKIDKLSALLLIPYILWVSFATWLNWSIWILN